MHLDVVDLREFYESRLGQVAQRLIRKQLRELWPTMSGLSLLGLGYATPFLRPFLAEAERVIAIMPAAQGVAHWPPEGPNVAALSDERELPLPDVSIDRLLLVHALETSEGARHLLRQAWRVLKSSGQMIVVAPNRRSLWAQIETTPFGHGHPYTRGQLSRLLRDCMFAPGNFRQALHMPPFASRVLTRTGKEWERAGRRLWPALSGVLIAEATKQVYGVTPLREAVKEGARVRVLKPVRGGAALLSHSDKQSH